MRVELYYLTGCPSYEPTLENLRSALRAEALSEDIEHITVDSEADAQAMQFLGSPTVRIDGVDLEGPADEERGYTYRCRVCLDAGEQAGWPSVTLVRKHLIRESSGRPRS